MKHIFTSAAYLRRLIFFLLVAGVSTTVDASSMQLLAKFDGSVFRTEIEISGDPGAYVAVEVDVSGTPVPLAVDAGETQWDIESDELSLAELNGFATVENTFRFFTDDGGGGTLESIYTLSAPAPSDLAASDFPDQATNLHATSNVNPLATWVGGDPTADALVLTYQDLSSFDEFGDAPLDPSTSPISYMLQQDLAVGTYEATLAYWSFFSNPTLTLQSGPDVFSPAADDIRFFLVGETFFSPVVVAIPVPAAAILFPSGLLAMLAWARKKKGRY